MGFHSAPFKYSYEGKNGCPPCTDILNTFTDNLTEYHSEKNAGKVLMTAYSNWHRKDMDGVSLYFS